MELALVTLCIVPDSGAPQILQARCHAKFDGVCTIGVLLEDAGSIPRLVLPTAPSSTNASKRAERFSVRRAFGAEGIERSINAAFRVP